MAANVWLTGTAFTSHSTLFPPNLLTSLPHLISQERHAGRCRSCRLVDHRSRAARFLRDGRVAAPHPAHLSPDFLVLSAHMGPLLASVAPLQIGESSRGLS